MLYVLCALSLLCFEPEVNGVLPQENVLGQTQFPVL
jgi:hypothetical protein